MRGFQNTRTRACDNCGSVFEKAAGDQWDLIQQVEGTFEARPAYALGTRGKLDGVDWEIVGWTERSVTVWHVRYAWEEHLLFNPYEGFRYLMLSDGHWSVVSPLPGVPSTAMDSAVWQGETFKHFQGSEAVVDEVLGEFPWQVRRGDVAEMHDYVAPPLLLSAEASATGGAEINWSFGRYLTQEEVTAAFGEPTRRIKPQRGIHPAQPNPHSALKGWMLRALAVGFVAWIALTIFYMGTRQDKEVWRGAVDLSGVTATDITLDSFNDPSTLEISASAPQLNNQWIYLDCMFVDPAKERASYAGVELEYYSGAGWSEGSRTGSETVSGVPNGKYVFQIHPHPQAPYKGTTMVRITRDVRLMRYPCCTLFLVFLVPVIVLVRARSFERMRWAESDHPMS